jgi:hypothetical protein
MGRIQIRKREYIYGSGTLIKIQKSKPQLFSSQFYEPMLCFCYLRGQNLQDSTSVFFTFQFYNLSAIATASLSEQNISSTNKITFWDK